MSPKLCQHASKKAPRCDFGRSWLDFGSPGGSILVIFRWSFARSGRFARRRSKEEATCEKLTKTSYFTSPNACQSFCGLCVHDSKIVKIRPKLASRVSRAMDRSPNALFSILEASRGFPRLLGAPCEASGDLSGRSWVALGALLGCSWGALGRSRALVGRSWAALGRLLGALGRSWRPPGRSWLDFGTSEGRFCIPRGCFCDPPRIDC